MGDEHVLGHGHRHDDGWVAGASSSPTGATSPPPRPAIPPKPGLKLNTSIGNAAQAEFSRRHSTDATSPSDTQPGRPFADRASIPYTFRSPATSATATTPTSAVTDLTISYQGHTTSPKSPNPVFSPGGSGPPAASRPNKPALPPKPIVSPSLLCSPPLTKFPPNCKVTPKFPVDNANVVNNNVPSTTDVANSTAEQNGNLHSPPAFLRTKPPQPPPPPPSSATSSLTGGDPSLSPRSVISSPPQSRPNSSAFFNFSSPIQNLNSANFPSTSGGLNQVGGGPHPGRVTSPQNLAQIRVKSASLGRNITFPFSSPSTTTSSSGGFFARKSATLSKFLPLDLHLGGSSKSPPSSLPPAVTSPTRPKANTLKSNPFIIQEKQKQQQMSQVNPALNFGKAIVFATSDSPMPPPPPPRLKKKLSPVNSLGSPSSPTSPFPLNQSHSFSLPPTSPLPIPPPISTSSTAIGALKTMEAVHESAEDVMAIYAEVNKEKKWAERKQKQDELTRKLSLDSSLPPTSPTQTNSPFAQPSKQFESSQNENSNNSNNLSMSQDIFCDSFANKPLNKETEEAAEEVKNNNDAAIDESETVVVKSWLRSHLANGEASSSPTNANNNISTNNPFRSVSPTYQSTRTGHIYETIGDNSLMNDDGLNNNVKNDSILNNNKNSGNLNSKLCNSASVTTTANALEIQETSEVIQTGGDGLSDNQSFLFKLVINPKIVTEAESPTPTTGVKNEINENDDGMITAENRNIKTDSEFESATSGSSSIIPADFNTVAVAQSAESDTTLEHQNTRVKPSTEARADAVVFKSSSSSHRNEEVCEKNDAASYLIPTVVQDFKTDEQCMNSNSSFQSTTTEGSVTATPPSRNQSILRRRSWNCDRAVGSGSPSPSESSSTASSITNLPYQHRRDRSFTSGGSGSGRASNRDSLLLRESDWVDEGDLSNGALADAESSDVQLRSSAEDLNNVHLRKGQLGAAASPLQTKGFSSRRLVNSIFNSFGKGSYSSSGSSGSASRKRADMRGGGKRGKEKAISHFFPMDPNSSSFKHGQRANHSQSMGGGKLGRQISDSVVSASMISGPILLPASSLSLDNGMLSHPHKSQSVQFSPEVPETRIIHSQYSSEEGKNGLPEVEEGVVALEVRDDESVSSSESVTGSVSGSVSGYEDILADLSPKEKKSFYVAREILTSERTFVDVLNLITIDFPRAVEVSSRYHGQPVISRDDLETILGGLPNLKQVNENLLADLEERVANWKDSPKIADILVKKGPFLKLYASYIKDFQKNSTHLDTCCQKYPLFAQVVRDFEMTGRCQKLGLKHYMLKPVQRMPQYRLLLEDYLKSLDKEESNDYEDTVKGIAIVKDVAEHANEAIRLQVNAEKLLHLQNRLSTGTIILKADRQLIKEGELLKVCRKVLQPRFFALMNDCLICFTYHAAAGSLKDLRVRYELPLAGMRISLSQEDYQNEFSVISVPKSFNLVAKSSRERDDWMKALNTAIEDNIKKRTCSTPDEEIGFQLGKVAPVWVQDSRVTMCQLCTAEFTIAFRRHHCRACGKVVCGNCSGGQAPLQYLNNASKRVCDSCYEYLLDEFDKTDVDLDSRECRSRASIRDRFKKVTPNVPNRASQNRKHVPSRLEVHANTSGSRISGYLSWREKEKKTWKRRWFVLRERVLYIYAASEDIRALKSIPLLGWQVEMDKPDPQQENEENSQSFFRVTHDGQHPISFQADSATLAEKWIAAMQEAVVL